MTADQMDLIDVQPENAKKIKALIRKRDKLHEQHLECKQAADQLDVEIMAAVKEAGGKPDVDGVIRIKVGDCVIVIKPGKANLVVKEENQEDQETPEAEDEFEAAGGGEQPALTSRRKARTQSE